MSGNLNISIDAMGGDCAPDMVIEGLELARQGHPNAKFLVFGDEQRIAPLLSKFTELSKCCEIRHTDEMVTNEDKVATALRGKRNSSMRLAINAVKDGEAAGIVSAGNTGALMAMAKFVLRTLPGIDRPAIATVLPTQKEDVVMLDLGANVDCSAENLVQFAVMGEVFARNVLGLSKPSVGILNIGEEELKGNDAVQSASTTLQAIDLPISFYGFVEGDDIGAGTVDVVVTDGFTGNIALKTAEGTAQMMGVLLKEAFQNSLLGKLGGLLAMPALKKFKAKFDPRQHNGAMFLGLNGICVKSHGGTDAFGFSHAVGVAMDLLNRNINEDIKADLEWLATHPVTTDTDLVEEK
ncbi:MAG: phosphate acyltransferase PlsX [Alphaproteobacteria bacterium]|nr:phosphate acyltransferase PlsX [Alphaproteobacteria bacterium]